MTITLILLFLVSVVQNAAFTAVSRSRNSGDVLYHAKWAVASNGLYYVNQVLIVGSVWTAINEGNLLFILLAGLVYVAATTIGSAAMMWRMLKTETGKQRVGAR